MKKPTKEYRKKIALTALRVLMKDVSDGTLEIDTVWTDRAIERKETKDGLILIVYPRITYSLAFKIPNQRKKVLKVKKVQTSGQSKG